MSLATDTKMVFQTTARTAAIAAGTALWTVFTLALMISDGSTVKKLNTELVRALNREMTTFLIKMFLSGR
jgi:hypothetical protein